MVILEIVILFMVCISLAFNIIVLKDISDSICHIKTDINVLFKKFSDHTYNHTYDESKVVLTIRNKLDDIIAKIDSQEKNKKENTKQESHVIRFIPESLDCNVINSVVSIPYDALEHVSEYDVKKALLNDITAQIQNYILLETDNNPIMEEVMYRGKLRILGQPVGKYDLYIFNGLKKED